MASYQFLNRVTGMPLHGFYCGEATEEEIAAANARLKNSGSELRLLPIESAVNTPTMEAVETPANAV